MRMLRKRKKKRKVRWISEESDAEIDDIKTFYPLSNPFSSASLGNLRDQLDDRDDPRFSPRV